MKCWLCFVYRLQVKIRYFFQTKQTLHLFWLHYPALRYAFLFLIGIGSAFLPYLFLFTPLFLMGKNWIKGISMILCGFLYLNLFFPKINIPNDLKGEALFHINQVKTHASPFKKCLVYEGEIKAYKTKESIYLRLPASIYIYQKKNRPLAHCDYLIPNASLIEIAPYRYLLKADKKTAWIPIKKSSSFAESRFIMKEKVRAYLSREYKTKKVYALMSSLMTGNNDNRMLTFQFSQLGLSHLLAISGFHFSLLTLFLMLLLKPFLGQKSLALLVIMILSGYFFYMGETPSISRAWIGVVIFLLGLLLGYRPSGLNTLGVALLVALFSNPLIIMDIGFQLSFAATLGILLFYFPFEQSLLSFLPIRAFKHTSTMPFIDQWVIIFAAFIRKTLALNGAVLSFILPLLLIHFQKFPLLSLCYNLFFSLLFSLVMALLLLGSFCSLIYPSLGSLIHQANESYAYFVLHLVSHAPKKLSFFLTMPQITPFFSTSLLFIILFSGLKRKTSLLRDGLSNKRLY